MTNYEIKNNEFNSTEFYFQAENQEEAKYLLNDWCDYHSFPRSAYTVTEALELKYPVRNENIERFRAGVKKHLKMKKLYA